MERPSRRNKTRARTRLLPAVNALERRDCPSVTIHSGVGPKPETIPLKGVQANDQVVLHVLIGTSDRGEGDEVDEHLTLHVKTSAGEFVDAVLGVAQDYSFTAQKAGESVTAFLAGGDGDESGTLDIATQDLRISTPSNQKIYHITGDPKMPDVTATVQAADGSDLSAVSFTWGARVWFPRSDSPYARYDVPVTVFTKTTTGPTVTFSGSDWNNMIRGGRLELTVKGTVSGKTLQGQLFGLTILGDNPDPATVKAYLGTLSLANFPSGTPYTAAQILTKISAQETGRTFHQFETNGMPFFNKGNPPDGGVGLMQITHPVGSTPANPWPTAEQVWDWKANAQAGAAVLDHALSLGQKFIDSLTTYTNDVYLPKLNAKRAKAGLAPIELIVLPAWTPIMQLRDGIRGYNGFNGNDFFYSKLLLHEYTLQKDGTGNLVLTIDKNGVATASWRAVKPTERPSAGDRSYVDNVLAQPY